MLLQKTRVGVPVPVLGGLQLPSGTTTNFYYIALAVQKFAMYTRQASNSVCLPMLGLNKSVKCVHLMPSSDLSNRSAHIQVHTHTHTNLK